MRKDDYLRYSNCPIFYKNLLRESVNTFRRILKGNLLGIYLHGSLALGGFKPNKSDVDLILVVRDPLKEEEIEEMASFCLDLSKRLGGGGLEMSVVRAKYTREPIFPMPYEFHFSEAWRDRFENGEVESFSGVDPDLSAHLRVIYERGVLLYGLPTREVFSRIPDRDYLRALFYDLEDMPELLPSNPEYYVLNLLRILAFLRTKKVMSKVEGGNWFLESEKVHQDVVRRALSDSLKEPDLNPQELGDFLLYILKRIKREIASYRFLDPKGNRR